jgi:hypothetical protein
MQTPTPGFHIIVNEVPRRFCDRKDHAFEAAINLKRRWPKDKVEIVEQGSDRRIEMLESGLTV